VLAAALRRDADKVTQGSVTVRDSALKRKLVINAPKSYFAKAP
jgi:hypothetical protein